MHSDMYACIASHWEEQDSSRCSSISDKDVKPQGIFNEGLGEESLSIYIPPSKSSPGKNVLNKLLVIFPPHFQMFSSKSITMAFIKSLGIERGTRRLFLLPSSNL
jgi:hypothetical protein